MTVTSRLHRQKDTERQRKTEENVERRPLVTPRYESGGEAQARERPARDRGLSLPKTCARLFSISDSTDDFDSVFGGRESLERI